MDNKSLHRRSVAEAILSYRKKYGISRSEFASKANVSSSSVAKWERCESTPNLVDSYNLSKTLGIPISAFFGEQNEQYAHACPRTPGMQSLHELYKIGNGPSSSHTMGPVRACKWFLSEYPEMDSVKVILFGSLAMTGRGHMTDVAITEAFSSVSVPCTVEFDTETADIPHPNTMEFFAYNKGNQIGFARIFSIGGGEIQIEGQPVKISEYIYPFNTYKDISEYCAANNMRLWQYVEMIEGENIWEYLLCIWKTMKNCASEGLKAQGTLPGGLNVQRKAHCLIDQYNIDETAETRENRLVCAYAFAVGEQNASGNIIVTAPTCGSAGVLPAVLLYQQKKHGYSDTQIIHSLATAGIIGNLIKTNASISGAECGCQAEVGSACSMAAAALAELFEMNLAQIEYSAEIAMEHHLGLTCDPIHGLVQIPCIERNAVAAMRSMNAVSIANFLTDSRKISFDLVVRTMYETGRDLSKDYRETSEGGLAKLYCKNSCE